MNPHFADQVRAARRLVSPDPVEIVSAGATYFDESSEWYRVRRSSARGRDLAAYLAHRQTTATLRELAPLFGLGHPDSVNNLIRRAQRDLAKSPQLRKQRNEIVSWLETPPKTENRV